VATRLAAVNCVTLASGQLEGSNTDGEGFLAALRHGDGFEPRNRRCLVIGAGGAARAVVLALAEAGAAEVIVVNRTESRAVVAAALAGTAGRVGHPEEAPTADLVVNATPAGMVVPEPQPQSAETAGSRRSRGTLTSGTDGTTRSGSGPADSPYPLDPELLVAGQVVVDLVYHPASTPWLRAARDQGAIAHNGLGMLVHQAAAQLRTWTGQDPPVAAMWRAATAALSAR
jgi:shikimate dehydrogenase